MSILDFPRLHFQGFARIHAPTGNKNGLVDLSTNTVYMNGKPFDRSRPVSDYHEYLQNLGERFNAEGKLDENGCFSMAKGWDFGGNGHFVIDAQIISTQREFGIDRDDPIVGRSVDMWGHHNEYLGTTFNRARIFDCDPASNWTSTIMVGQLTFGRKGASHEVPYMLSAPVEGMQPARWQDFNHIRDLPKHCLNREFQRAAVHQFTVSKSDKDFFWDDSVSVSPTVSLLREAMKRDDVLGLVVQFGLSNMSAPTQPDTPVFWELHGSIGLWCEGEMSTYPDGRLLTGAIDESCRDARSRVSTNNLTVKITPDRVSLNMVTAVPCVGRAVKPEGSPIHAIASKLDLGELELRTVTSQKLIARIPSEAYQKEAHQLTSGIVDVPLAESFENIGNEIDREGLCIIATRSDGQKEILLREQEINLQVNDACLFVEYPNRKRGEDYAVELEVFSFVRGRPSSVESIYLRQFYNPRGLPQLKYQFEFDPNNFNRTFHYPHSYEHNIVEFKPGKLDEIGEFNSKCVISTGDRGRGWVTLRGLNSGTTRVLLSASSSDIVKTRDLARRVNFSERRINISEETSDISASETDHLTALSLPSDSPVPCSLFPVPYSHPDEAIIAYDNDNNLNFWAGAGSFAVRVLANDWHLEDIPDRDVDFQLIYEHFLAYYELTFSFMKAEVFSLADRCKVETYARLMWQMSDPAKKNKTYYMPPTHDMSYPQAMLLRKFLNNQQQIGYVPEATPIPKQTQRNLQTRDELVIALKHAAELEIAVMLQYIYAGYSIPNYATGEEYVRRGLWTPKQLLLACGDGKEKRNYGMRGVLLEVSHEEMIHFLMVNNILMAIGEPFYPAIPDFNEINKRFPIEVDFALEPLNVTSIQRFIGFEFPDFLAEDLNNEVNSYDSARDCLHAYGSLSELYRQIREGLENIPDLFVVKKGNVGGEHHLFLREDTNKHHPDFQFEVYDLNSALFAIDFIVEQGEGCDAESRKFQQSHYQQFRRIAEALAKEQITNSNHRKLPWNPSYPALRNPTLNHRDRHTNVVTVPETRMVMEIFNECYFIMMQLMVQHFGFSPTASLRRSKLMNASIDIMTGMMRPLGELLMTMPSGKRGKTAGASFEIETPIYIPTPEIAYQSIARRFQKLEHQAKQCQAIPNTVCEMFQFYQKFFLELKPDQ